MRTSILVLSILSILFVTGCGTGSTPEPTLTPAEQEYIDAISTQRTIIDNIWSGVNQVWQEFEKFDAEWASKLAIQLEPISIAYDELMAMEPPDSMAAIHYKYIQGMKHYNTMAELFTEFLGTRGGGLITEAGDEMIAGYRDILEANDMLNEFKRAHNYVASPSLPPPPVATNAPSAGTGPSTGPGPSTGSTGPGLSYDTGVTTGGAVVLPDAISDETYSATITGKGGTARHTFTLEGATSIGGTLSLSQAGVISGTAPTAVDTRIITFQVNMVDAAGKLTVLDLSLTVHPPPIILEMPERIEATAGEKFVHNFSNLTGGKPPYSFTVSGQPMGLIMKLNGDLSGTIPENAILGEYPVEVCVRDSTGAQDCGNTIIDVAGFD